jgi:membrane-bound lytic murein transglycosylase B
MLMVSASVRLASLSSGRLDMTEPMNHSPDPPVRSGIGGTLGLLAAILVIAGTLVWVLLNVSAAVSAPAGERGSEAPPAVAPEPPVADTDAAADTVHDAATSSPAPMSSGPDPAWVARVAAATGIPERAMTAYASAALAISTMQPGCGLGWNTIAAIGSVESDHGRHGGAVLGTDGFPEPAVRGAALDGNGVQAIPDTDGGRWDADTVWDRAVGPMQFIPSTWSSWGSDGNGDGDANPNQIDDAALGAARYLCASGSVATAEAWRAAVFSYNNLDSYVDEVARRANEYAARAG